MELAINELKVRVVAFKNGRLVRKSHICKNEIVDWSFYKCMSNKVGVDKLGKSDVFS